MRYFCQSCAHTRSNISLIYFCPYLGGTQKYPTGSLHIGLQEIAEACLHSSLTWFMQRYNAMAFIHFGSIRRGRCPLALSNSVSFLPNDNYSWQQTLREKNYTFTVYGEKGMLKASRKTAWPYIWSSGHCKAIL